MATTLDARGTPDAESAGPGGPRLRVAVVTEYYYPHIGGICENVHHFAAEARARGHHVDVITGRIAGVPPRPHVITIPDSATVQANGSTCHLRVRRHAEVGFARTSRDSSPGSSSSRLRVA